MAKDLQLYRLGVVLDVKGAQGLSTLKSADRELKAVDQDSRKAEKSLGLVGGALNKLSSGVKGMFGGGGFLPGLSHVSNIIQGIPQIGQLAGALVQPLTDAAQAGVRFNAFLETTEHGLKKTFFKGDLAKAKTFLREMRDFAGKTPFRTEPLVKTVQYMGAVSFKAHEVKGVLTDVGDAIAATGELSEEAVQSVVRAFGKIRSEGRVTAENMEMLTDAGIPAWEMLAHAIGKSVAQTRKLSETSKLTGPAAVEAVRAEMRARYGGTMKEMEGTLSGRLSAAEDVIQSATAKSMESTTVAISASLGAALQRADLADSLAGKINTALTPVAGMVRAAAVGLLGGGITEGLSEGIKAGKDLVGRTIKDFAIDQLIGGFKSWLGINSPATTMIPLGHSMAEGIAVGLDEGVDMFAARMAGTVDRLTAMLEGHANGRGRRRLSTQQVNRRRLEQIAAQEPGFLDALRRGSAKRGINPDDFLNLMAVESGFRKSVLNRWGYLGLGQVGRAERGMLGLPKGDREAQALFARNSHTWQLENVLFPFYDIKNRASRRMGHGNLSDLSEMYAAWGSGHSKGDPAAVHAARGGLRSSMYRNNPAWDPNRDGRIQEYEFGIAARAALGAGINFSVNGAPVSASNPVPVVVASFSAGADLRGVVGTFAQPARQAKPPAPVEQVKGGVAENVNLAMQELPVSTQKAGWSMTALENATRQAEGGVKEIDLAFGHAAKSVIGSAKKLDQVVGAVGQIAGMVPGQQVGKKRGFFSKILGFAAPFLNFIPGVGPILSTLAGIGSSALAGDWGGAITGAVGGFSPGGVFRGTGNSLPSGSGPSGSLSGAAQAGLQPGSTARALPPRAVGGPVRRGRTYIVGEHRPEVFEAEEDGYIHPSTDAYERSRRAGGPSLGKVRQGSMAAMIERLLEAANRQATASEALHGKLASMPAEHVVTTGLRRNPGAATDAFMSHGSRDPRVVEWMNRRIAA